MIPENCRRSNNGSNFQWELPQTLKLLKTLSIYIIHIHSSHLLQTLLAATLTDLTC